MSRFSGRFEGRFGSRFDGRFAASGALSRAALRAFGEDETFSIDFTDQSVFIKDTDTPANNKDQIGTILNGTRVGPGSVLTYTAPSLKLTLQSDGYYKYQPHNLGTYSEDVTNGWTALNATKSGADTFYETATTAQHAIYQTINPNIVGASYVWQVEVKGIGRTEVALSLNDTNAEYSYFTISGAGSVGTTAANNVESTIEALDDGWYRIKIRKVSKNLTMFPAVYGSVSENVVYLGDVTKGYMVRKMQRNRYPATTDYIKTTTVAVYGLPYSWDSSGVLQGVRAEDASTNLLLRSSQFDNATWNKTNVSVTPNAAVAPDGTTTADLLTASGGTPTMYQGITGPGSASSVTFSIWLKSATGGSFTIAYYANGSGVDPNPTTGTLGTVTTEWQRFSATVVAAASVGTINLTLGDYSTGWTAGNNVYAWDAQAEPGDAATSPIETFASTVTRAADILTEPTSAFPTGAANTLFIEFTPDRTASFHALLGMHETGGLTDRYDLAISGDTARFTVADGGVTQADITENGISAGTTYKLAARGEENLTRHCLDGALSTQDTSCTMPAVADLDVLDIGHRNSGGVFTGVIRSFMISPRGWSDAEMQTLTT